MTDYVLKEVPVTGDNPNKEKLFRTPSGNTFVVRVNPVPGGLNLTVHRNDEGRESLNTVTVPFQGMSPEALRGSIENQLATAIQTAEEQEESKQAARAYMLDTWGIDINAPATPALPGLNPAGVSAFPAQPKIQFLGGSTAQDDEED